MDVMPGIVDQKKPHVVCVPFPAQSHTKCMLKLARLLHHKGLQVTFVNAESNHTRLLKHAGSHHLGGSGDPGFEFRTVPDGLPSTSNGDHDQAPTINQISGYLRTNFLASFLELVAGLETPATCIISDAMMTTYAKTTSAAEKLGIPIILFWTVAACGFMGSYQAKLLVDKGIVPLKDESYLTNGYLDTLIDIPGMKDIRLKDLPEQILGTGPTASTLTFIVKIAHEADKCSHMIIHTFEELESSLVKELKSMFPNVYTIGPLQLLLNQITEKETKKSNFNGYSLRKEEPECIQWLQSKKPNSVVYVNFGSMVVMSLQELLELCWGLVNSNHDFVLIIRSDLVSGDQSAVLGPELEEEIKKRGFVASWCSQEEVLNHPSVGGFLTHGGWGSVIESLSAGVPMVCWPVTGDQRTNCRQMCKEWEVGMEIGGGMKRDEVEKLVRTLMEGDEGAKLRNKAMEWRKIAETATSLDGSSCVNVERLVNEISMFSRN